MYSMLLNAISIGMVPPSSGLSDFTRAHNPRREAQQIYCRREMMNRGHHDGAAKPMGYSKLNCKSKTGRGRMKKPFYFDDVLYSQTYHLKIDEASRTCLMSRGSWLLA